MEDTLKIVEELNDELYDLFGDQDNLYFYMSTNYVDIIGYSKFILWDSEDSTRKWDEKTNSYEPLKQFVKNELNKLGKELIKITTEDEEIN